MTVDAIRPQACNSCAFELYVVLYYQKRHRCLSKILCHNVSLARNLTYFSNDHEYA